MRSRRGDGLRQVDASSLIGAFHLAPGEQLVAHVHLAGLVLGAPLKVVSAGSERP